MGRNERGRTMSEFRKTIEDLYLGTSRRSVRFRYGLIIFDFLTIIFFVIVAPIEHGPWLTFFSVSIGLMILCDFLARLWVAEDRKFMFWRVYTLADIVVIASLLLDPFLTGNVAFLRVLRGLRLIHSYQLLQDLRRDSDFFRRHEDMVIASVNLIVFVMVTWITVLVFFIDRENSAMPYIDALYFTMSTLTTTGYGDITMTTPGGKLFSIFVMAVGVALFVRLAQALFRPQKVRYKCPTCGLLRHDPDAIHCKHCGGLVHIETLGSD